MTGTGISMSGGGKLSDEEELRVVPSHRSLMTSLPVIGWCLLAVAALLCGGLLAGGAESWLAAVVSLVVAAVLAGTILLLSRYLTLKRLRPRFIVSGTLLSDDQGRTLDLQEMDGIQTWVVDRGDAEPAQLHFALIPRGEPARVDPKAVVSGTYGRHWPSAPPELVAYTFCYQSQLRPRLHVFTAELQRRAPHLFLDHVGVM